jgi:riboflavin kinase/FMN adenylyltransferase
VKRLYGTDEKMKIFEGLGVDFAVVADFASISSLSAEEFVKTALVGQMGCRVAVIGFNFRFGRGAEGDAETLCRLMAECGGDCEVRRELTLDGQTVCTTLIRSCLESGDIEKATKLLGMPYKISSCAVHGRGVGKKLGFPTVNTALEPWIVELKRGVYRTAVKADGRFYNALTNVGVCPTFEQRESHAETYILGFDGDLYGKTIDIYLLEFMRDEIRFNSEKELIMQINVDIEQVIKKNGEIKWQELGLK